MIEWYYILGIISYGIFLVQFCLSFIMGEIDTDLDIDFDGDTDFSLSDLVSFKGLIHFLMGFSGWLVITGEVTILSLSIACIIGILFVVILYYVYRLTLKFTSEPTVKTGVELIGQIVTVYLTMPEISSTNCIGSIFNGGATQEINCVAAEPVKIGDIRVILGYKNGIYYIS